MAVAGLDAYAAAEYVAAEDGIFAVPVLVVAFPDYYDDVADAAVDCDGDDVAFAGATAAAGVWSWRNCLKRNPKYWKWWWRRHVKWLNLFLVVLFDVAAAVAAAVEPLRRFVALTWRH